MTPDDLAAIRARDAENRLLRLGPDADPDLGEWMGDAVRDRRALLAEVDRLTAELAEERGNSWWASADVRERARIRAAVEGLTAHIVGGYEADCDTCIRWSDELQTDVDERGIPCDLFDRGGVLNRDAVLAAIDGE